MRRVPGGTPGYPRVPLGTPGYPGYPGAPPPPLHLPSLRRLLFLYLRLLLGREGRKDSERRQEWAGPVFKRVVVVIYLLCFLFLSLAVFIVLVGIVIIIQIHYMFSKHISQLKENTKSVKEIKHPSKSL